MADNIRPPLRQAAAIALVAIGALAAAPWLVKITLGQINWPEIRVGKSRSLAFHSRGFRLQLRFTTIY